MMVTDSSFTSVTFSFGDQVIRFKSPKQPGKIWRGALICRSWREMEFSKLVMERSSCLEVLGNLVGP